MTMKQLDFTFKTPVPRRQRLIDPTCSPALREQFSRRLQRYFDERPFRLRFNDNASTVLSVRERYGRLELSLHHLFIEAGEAELRALADYLRGRRRGGARLDAFIERNRTRIGRRRDRASGRGQVYDLEGIRDALARTYFDGPLAVPVVWGSDRRRRSMRSIRLGSYSFEDGVVRIHPVLDQRSVPPYVVVAVVYHELLHHVVGAEHKGGRRLVHTAAFRRREQRYIHHRRAERWERDNLDRLLGRRR